MKRVFSTLALGLLLASSSPAADAPSWGSLLDVQRRLDSVEGRMLALEARVAEIERISREIQAAVQPKAVVAVPPPSKTFAAGTVLTVPEVAAVPLPLGAPAPYLIESDCPTGQCGMPVTAAQRAVIRSTWSSPGIVTAPTITVAPGAAYFGGTSGGCSTGFRARTTIRTTGGGAWYPGKFLFGGGGCGG